METHLNYSYEIDFLKTVKRNRNLFYEEYRIEVQRKKGNKNAVINLSQIQNFQQ